MARSNELIRSVSIPFNTTSEYAARLDLEFDEPVSARAVEEQLSPIKKRGDLLIGLEKRLGPQYISCEGSGDWYVTPVYQNSQFYLIFFPPLGRIATANSHFNTHAHPRTRSHGASESLLQSRLSSYQM